MMAPPKLTPAEESAAARRARYLFYVLGGFFVLLTLASDLMPQLAGVVPEHAVKFCALLAVVFLGLGRFAPDRWVRRCAGLISGWP